MTGYKIDNDDRGGFYFIDNIDWPNGCYSMSYGIFLAQRNRGHGARLAEAGVDYAFEVLNLRRGECEVLGDNHTSIRCLEKAGFVLEGTKRRAIARCGLEIDSLMYGILRSDWLNLKRVRDMDGFCNLNVLDNIRQ